MDVASTHVRVLEGPAHSLLQLGMTYLNGFSNQEFGSVST